jgi:hypothetical protein
MQHTGKHINIGLGKNMPYSDIELSTKLFSTATKLFFNIFKSLSFPSIGNFSNKKIERYYAKLAYFVIIKSN